VLVAALSVSIFTESSAQTVGQVQQLMNQLPPGVIQGLAGQSQLPGQGVEQALPEAIQPPVAGDVGEPEEEIPDGPPRLVPGDTLVIEFVVRSEDWVPTPVQAQLSSSPPVATPPAATPPAATPVAGQGIGVEFEPEENQVLDQGMLDRLIAGNPYQLDDDGFVVLPGVPPIQLAGLSVEEAMVRIRAEPSLVWLQPVVTYLPLVPFGIDSLEAFGYRLFVDDSNNFSSLGGSASYVPIPSEYVMGPGDVVNVLLFGNVNPTLLGFGGDPRYRLMVSRDGAIDLPTIGPVSVAGLTFEQLQTAVMQRVEEQMIGVRANITLGALRSIRVFVVGDVPRPGPYMVSGLSTITNALFVSGGVNAVGSLRKIELRRAGQLVSTLDLYDLLLRGDTGGDERLQPDDVIFSPPIGDSIHVHGDVRRPAIYELNGERTVEEVIALAGGFSSSADQSAIKLERTMPGGTTAYNIDLTTQTGGVQSLQDGDILLVPSRLEQLDNTVRLSGNVFQPGLYPWHEGLTLTDLIDSRELIKPRSDLRYVLIRREIQPNVLTEVFSIDLQSAWNDPGGTQDVVLQSRDTVYVFDRLNSRQDVISELLDELRAQRFRTDIIPLVRVGGQVNSPGDYPLEPGMTVAGLVRAGGGLTESAYALDAELVRYSTSNSGAIRQTEIITVDLGNSLIGVPGADISLSPYDHLNIKVVPNWTEQEVVELVGELIFPGIYPLREGETLMDVLTRAGGLTEFAFPEGAIFIREELQAREAEQLENLANRLERDIQGLATDPQNAPAVAAGAALVASLRNVDPVGRLVIDLSEILEGNIAQNIVLRNGDQLYIPPISQEIIVLGEVQYPTSHVFEGGLNRDTYIEMSGGTTDNADIGRIYTVHANGRVDVNSSLWFSGESGGDIMPGDTVVVPIDTSVSVSTQIPVWAAATQVFYNIAIAAAALNSF